MKWIAMNVHIGINLVIGAMKITLHDDRRLSSHKANLILHCLTIILPRCLYRLVLEFVTTLLNLTLTQFLSKSI
jgi:hypothetical protein